MDSDQPATGRQAPDGVGTMTTATVAVRTAGPDNHKQSGRMRQPGANRWIDDQQYRGPDFRLMRKDVVLAGTGTSIGLQTLNTCRWYVGAKRPLPRTVPTCKRRRCAFGEDRSAPVSATRPRRVLQSAAFSDAGVAAVMPDPFFPRRWMLPAEGRGPLAGLRWGRRSILQGDVGGATCCFFFVKFRTPRSLVNATAWEKGTERLACGDLVRGRMQ